MRLSTKEVRVPHAQKTTQDGNVLLERGLAEVAVHSVCTSQELVEVLVSNVQADGQANGRPDRVTATDPVREAEHVLGVNTELLDLLLVSRQSDEMLRDRFLIRGLLEEPLLGGVSVGGRLSGGERLGCD